MQFINALLQFSFGSASIPPRPLLIQLGSGSDSINGHVDELLGLCQVRYHAIEVIKYVGANLFLGNVTGRTQHTVVVRVTSIVVVRATVQNTIHIQVEPINFRRQTAGTQQIRIFKRFGWRSIIVFLAGFLLGGTSIAVNDLWVTFRQPPKEFWNSHGDDER